MKNRDNLILGGIFLFLLVFYILQKTVFKPDTRSFREELTNFDPESIDRIRYERNGEVIDLEKTHSGWTAANDQLSVPAREGSVDNLVRTLSELKTKQLVSRSPEKWAEYELDDANARIWRFYSGEKAISQLFIGRFDYDQQTQSSVSYARLDGENDIYAIDGFVSMTASRDFNSFRENKLFEFNATDIQSIKMITGDLEETVQHSLDGQWVFDGAALDSTRVADYLNRLSGLSGTEFNDEFLPGTGFGVVQSLHLNDTLRLDAYLSPSGGFVMTSSQNDAYFNSDSTGIFRQAFLDLENLLGGDQ
jgi:hypothetical protein